MTLREYRQRIDGYNQKSKLDQAQLLLQYEIYRNTWYIQGRSGHARKLNKFLRTEPEHTEPITDPDNLLENAYKMWNRPKLEKNG